MEVRKMGISLRGEDWLAFTPKVLTHIETYTIPQYGDKGADVLSKKSAKYCIECIEKYCARFGKNSREGQQELDLLKIAHLAQVAFTFLKEENDASKVS